MQVPSRSAFSVRFEPIFLLCVLSIASILIFTNIGNDCLWSDEAETAHLARTVLTHGLPKGIDGLNSFSIDWSGQKSDMTRTGIWIITPWLPYYLLAPFTPFDPFTSEWLLRMPFAVFGLATILFSYFLCKRFFGDKVATLTAAFFLFLVPFLLYSRQCRYYTLAMFFSVWLMYGYDRFLKSEKGFFKHALLSQLFLFHTNYLIWASITSGLSLHFFLFAFDRQKLKVFFRLALSGIVFNLPWLLLFKSGAAKSLASPAEFLANIWDYILETNNHLIPFSFACLASYFTLSKPPRSWSLLWHERTQCLETNRLCLILCLILSNIFIASFSGPHFFRYLAGLIPFTIMLQAFFAYRLFMKRKILGSLAIMALLLTDLFAFPLKWLSVPYYITSADQKKTYLPTLARAHLPFLDYLRMIANPKQDPNRSIVEFLRNYANPGEKVLAGMGDHAIKYYLPELKVFGPLEGADVEKEKMNEAEWLIPRKVVAYIDPGFNLYIDSLSKSPLYEKFQLNVADHYENIPEPKGHILDWTQTPFAAPVEIYRRITPYAENDKRKGAQA